MAAITLKSITKRYGETPVLHGIDLDIREGEFLTLVGPSGCGKSTLLRVIAGLEDQSGGNVSIGQRNMDAVKACHRDLAMVFQSYALYPHLTVRENMKTPLRLRDMTHVERFPVIGRFLSSAKSKESRFAAIVDETAGSLKIEHLLDRKPGQLSGGQRQRVALGRAMVRKPIAFLMDEPLSNLDAALRIHMRAELAELHRSLGTTFVYVTHDQAEALTMSDRVAVMMDGHIIQLGSPEEIYNNPQDKRVAEFIGAPKINMLQGRASAGGRVDILRQPVDLQVASGEAGLLIGIRPEHLYLATGTDAHPSWKMTVTHKENLGSDCYLHGRLEAQSQRIIARVTPQQARRVTIEEQIPVTANAGHMMVFAQDNRRLPAMTASWENPVQNPVRKVSG